MMETLWNLLKMLNLQIVNSELNVKIVHVRLYLMLYQRMSHVSCVTFRVIEQLNTNNNNNIK